MTGLLPRYIFLIGKVIWGGTEVEEYFSSYVQILLRSCFRKDIISHLSPDRPGTYFVVHAGFELNTSFDSTFLVLGLQL